MKQNYLKSFFARCLTLLILALLSTNLAWGEEKTYTYDFSGVKNTSGTLWFEDANKEKSAGCYTSTNKGTAAKDYYYKDGTKFNFYAVTNYYFSAETATKSSYFMLGKSGAYVVLPTFANEKITKVTLHSSTDHSTNVTVNIFSGDNAASTNQKWETKNNDYSYDVSANYQSSELKVKVTNSYNTQFTSITITTETEDANQVATPTITPSEVKDAYFDPITVTLGCETEGAAIHYTTNGDTPTSESTLYNEPFTVSATTTIKAIAIKSGLTNSSVANKTFTFGPVFNSLADLVAANLESGTTVKVSFSNVPIKSIYTSSGKRHGIYFDIQKGEKDIEIYYNSEEVPADWIPGGKVSGTMICPWKNYYGTWELAPAANSWSWNNLTYGTAVATPTISPATGTYYEVQTVTLSTSTEDATIRYTLDGTDPTSESSEYSETITIDKSCTLKAKAFKDGMDASDVASAEYVLKVTTPTLSVPAGVYTSTQNVELSTSTPDAVIRYTTDGKDVTESSNVYTDAITISEETTLKAKAFKTGWEASEQIEAKYTFSTPATITLMDKGAQYGEVINTAVGANVMAALVGVEEPTGRSTMSDYVFKGWAQNKSTDNPNIIDESTVATANMVLYAVYGKTTADEISWEAEDLADLTSSDVFVITGAVTTNSITKTYSMSNNNGISSAPTAAEVTISESKITSDVSDNIKWNISGNATDGYTFYPNGSTKTWLYCNTTATSSSNDNLRVGTGNRKIFESETSGYIVTKDNNTKRYYGIYNGNGWRGYTSINDNIKNQIFAYYKQVVTPGETTYDFEESNKSLTVTYNANGAEGDVPTCSTLYAKGETHTLLNPENLTKEGHTFAYWTTDEAGEGTHYNVGSTYTFTENSVTFYAQWTANKYNVAIGEVDGVVVTATYNETETISEGGNANVAYGTEVTLTVTGLTNDQDIVWDVEGATVAPEKGTPATFTVGTSAITVNATVQTVRNYELVTSNEGLVAGGEYILVSTKTDETSYVANTLKGSNDYLGYVDIVAPVENVISITDEAINPIVLGKNGEKWYLNSKEGQYGAKVAKKILIGEDTEWSITINDESHVASISNEVGGIKYNRSSPRFLIYASGQADIYLYKLQKTPSTSTFNVSGEGYTTFYTTDEFLMPEGAQGGIIRAKDENSVTIDYIYPAGSVVPSETPLVIKGTKNTEFTYTVTNLGSEYDGINYLCGVPEPNYTTVAPETGDYKFYKLTYYSSTIHTIGFYYGAPDGAAFVMKNAGKAYLALPAEQAAKIGDGFGFDEEITGISEIQPSIRNNQSPIYNLNGVRVNDMVKGNVYIINGKKYLCK